MATTQSNASPDVLTRSIDRFLRADGWRVTEVGKRADDTGYDITLTKMTEPGSPGDPPRALGGRGDAEGVQLGAAGVGGGAGVLISMSWSHNRAVARGNAEDGVSAQRRRAGSRQGQFGAALRRLTRNGKEGASIDAPPGLCGVCG